MKKKSLYLLVIIVAAILLLMLGTTKVKAALKSSYYLDLVDKEITTYNNFRFCFAPASYGEPYCGGNCIYGTKQEANDDGEYNLCAFAIDYIGNEKNVEIPSKVDNVPVMKIADCTFANSNVENVIIPDTVTEIENDAFVNCDNLKIVTIPKNVLGFGDDIFEGCSSKLVIKCAPNSRALQYAFDNNVDYSLTSKINIVTNKYIWKSIDTSKKTYTGSSRKVGIYIDYSFNLKDGVTDASYDNYAYYDLVKGKDYNVSYSNNVNIGTATVTITGIGNYTGTITEKFKIIPTKTEIKSAKNSSKKAIKAKWKKDKNVTGYEVYLSEKVVDPNYMAVNAKELSVRAKPTTKSEEYAILGRGEKVRILKKNVKKANGYTWYKIRVEGEGETFEGYVASKFLTTAYKAKKYKCVKTITKNKTTSYTVKKLKKGKIYYVKVRSYKTVNGKKYYSDYSKVKSVQIKK